MKKIAGFFSFPLNTDKRIYGLDVMRAIAILLVLASHARVYVRGLFPVTDYLNIGGFLGVELFFVLSGFLIGGILIKTMNAESGFSFSAVRKFWRRRWYRTLPNYYLILLVNILFSVFVFHNFSKEYFSFFFFLQNFAEPHPRLFEEAWSLSVEEWFYLLLPLVMLLIFYVGRKYFSPKQIVLFSALLFIVLVLLLRIIYVQRFDPAWGNGIRKVVIFRLDTVIWGVLAAWVKFYYAEVWNRIRTISFWFSLLLFAALIYIYFTDIRGEEASFFAKTFYFTLVSIAAMMLLPTLSNLKISGTPNRIQQFFTYTSIISYSLYLVHFSIVVHLISVTLPFSPIRNLFSFFIFWIGSFLISALLYKYYEKRFLDLRERSL